MKKDFRILMTFLKGTKKDKIIISWYAPDGRVDWNWPNFTGISNIPENILDVVVRVAETKVDEVFNFDCWSENDYYILNMEIYPQEKKIKFNLEAENYKYETSTYERELTNSDLEDYFKRTGAEIIEARYSGSGDSGDIDSVRIDGEDTDIYWHSNDPDKKLIWDTLYDKLESAYGGWEIDDGSSGTIELNNNMEIVITHEWNFREMELCEQEVEINEFDL